MSSAAATVVHVHHTSSVHPTPTPTVTTLASPSNGLSAYVTSCPTCETPNVVHVVVHTTLTISDFARYYSTPISSFRPSYIALQDGSLISSVYTPNLRVSESWLVAGGALSVFFLWNTWTAIRYCRLVNVKNKSLFYMLVASQAMGILVSVFFVIADFNSDFDCTVMGMFKKAGLLVSTTLMVTGILGTKAYRCLSNAGFVIVTLALLRAAIIAVCGIVIVEYRGGRRFTGTCETVFESPLLPLAIILQFIETCFLCGCFFWAVYRSYHSPADHARLSLPLEDEDEASSVSVHEKEDELPGAKTRRGWWDYVPNPDAERNFRPPTSRCSTPRDLVGRFKRWWSGEPMLTSGVFQRKPSLPGELPLPQPRRSSGTITSSLRIPAANGGQHPRSSSPPPPSVMERIIRYVPRADLLRNVLKNELLYTTFITAVLFVIAIVMLVGVTRQLLLGANGWIMLDWFVISICTMHSFGRVAHRHEREAWSQNPTNWRSIRHAEIEDETALRPKNRRRAWSPVSIASNWRHRQRGESDGFSSVNHYRSSDFPETSSQRPSPFTRSPELSACVSRSTSMSVVSSPSASLDSGFRPPVPRHSHYRGSPTILPSPEYPLSGSSTPQSDSHDMLSRVNAPPQALRSSSAPVSVLPPAHRTLPVRDPENPEPPNIERK